MTMLSTACPYIFPHQESIPFCSPKESSALREKQQHDATPPAHSSQVDVKLSVESASPSQEENENARSCNLERKDERQLPPHLVDSFQTARSPPQLVPLGAQHPPLPHSSASSSSFPPSYAAFEQAFNLPHHPPPSAYFPTSQSAAAAAAAASLISNQFWPYPYAQQQQPQMHASQLSGHPNGIFPPYTMQMTPWLQPTTSSPTASPGSSATQPPPAFPPPPPPRLYHADEAYETSQRHSPLPHSNSVRRRGGAAIYGQRMTRDNKRVVFDDLQLEALKALFERTHHIKREARIVFGNGLGLTEHQVKIWFQNQRYKCRKSGKLPAVNPPAAGGAGHPESGSYSASKFPLEMQNYNAEDVAQTVQTTLAEHQSRVLQHQQHHLSLGLMAQRVDSQAAPGGFY